MTEYDYLQMQSVKMAAEENMRRRHLKAQQEIDIMMNDIKERNEKMSSSAKEIDAELDKIDSIFDELNS